MKNKHVKIICAVLCFFLGGCAVFGLFHAETTAALGWVICGTLYLELAAREDK